MDKRLSTSGAVTTALNTIGRGKKAVRTRRCSHRGRIGRGIALPGSPGDYRKSRERCKLPSGGPGQSPGRK